MAAQPDSRVLRFRYLGTLAHTLKIANVFEIDVKHGTIFDVPEKWAYALKQRGTPVEEVSADAVAEEPVTGALEVLPDPSPAPVSPPEDDAQSDLTDGEEGDGDGDGDDAASPPEGDGQEEKADDAPEATSDKPKRQRRSRARKPEDDAG